MSPLALSGDDAAGADSAEAGCAAAGEPKDDAAFPAFDDPVRIDMRDRGRAANADIGAKLAVALHIEMMAVNVMEIEQRIGIDPFGNFMVGCSDGLSGDGRVWTQSQESWPCQSARVGEMRDAKNDHVLIRRRKRMGWIVDEDAKPFVSSFL
jgi:hypothetical protein